MKDLFLLLTAIYIWPKLNLADKTGQFRVIFGGGKIIYREENPKYYRNIIFLWRTTAIILGAGSLFLLIMKFAVRH